MAYFIGAVIYSLIFGAITKYIAESKGYEGGFWWGFFLGVIGLLVVGFRPDMNQQPSYSTTQPTVRDYSSSSYQDETNARAEQQNAIAAEKQWVCISCSTTNPEKAKFCFECGEPRHYDWKCSKCGEVNTAKTKYCFIAERKKISPKNWTPVLSFPKKE